MKYRIKQYNVGAWCIEELVTYGENSKRHGKQEWKIIKYPGNLEQAAKRLLDLVLGSCDEMDVQQLITAVAGAQAEIIANVQGYVER